jgi:type II secretory pathway pseudopilin PulG
MPIFYRGRRTRGEFGFGLIDVTVALAIMATGAVVMITVLPEILGRAQSRTAASQAYIYASTFVDAEFLNPYSGIINGSGDFSSLIPQMAGQTAYTWNRTVVETRPGLEKKVSLEIAWGAGADERDTFVFFVADVDDN